MIFPFYLDGKFPYRQKISHSLVLNQTDHIKSTESTQNITLTKKYSHPSDGLQWLRKKSPKNNQIKKFNSLNSIRRKNFCQLPLAKFFIRKRSLLEGKYTQQSEPDNTKSRQKRLYTQSQFLDSRRRNLHLHLDQTLNKSFLDTDHNFTGKSYHHKRVDNHLNINSPQSFPQSKLKKFLNTAKNITTHKQTSIQHNNSNSLDLNCQRDQQNCRNLFVKRISIKDKVQMRKFKRIIQQDNNDKQENQQQSMNVKLRRQIEKSVKNDIKAEVNKYKHSKLSKLKFNPTNTLKSGKKSLVIEQQQTQKKIEQNQQHHQQQPQIISESVSKFLTHYNRQSKFNWNSKPVQVIKKSHSSFNTYELEERDEIKGDVSKLVTKGQQKLQPWEGESTEFYGFR